MARSARMTERDKALARSIADLMRRAREQTGMTQAEFARQLNVHNSSICHAESGRTLPSIQRLDEWAQLCGRELVISMKKKAAE